MIVISGSESKSLAEAAAEEAECEYVETEKEIFPDGEIYVRILGDVEDEEVAVVQSTCKTPNKNYMELFLLLDAAKDLGAKKVSAIIPYFAYARQDERFEPGEAVSQRTVAKLIKCAGADEVYMVDLHAHRIESAVEIFDIPTHNLTAAPTLAEYIDEKYDLDDPVVLGPDAEAEQWAKKGAEAIDAAWDYMVKKRHGPEDVEITPRKLEVEGRPVLIIDDIISTGGTMVEAIDILKDHGAKKVYAACTHPVLSGEALENIREAGVEEVVGTDTIDSEISRVSVAPVIAEAIQ